jgi:hypothetical protein
VELVWQQDVADLVDDGLASQDVGGGDAHLVDPVRLAPILTAEQTDTQQAA